MKQTSNDNHFNKPLIPTWPDYNVQDVVCDCMAVKRKEIMPLANKLSGIDDLVSCSGAGSVCTGCHPLLQEIMGTKVWTPVEIIAVQQVSAVAKSFRFKSLEDSFTAADSGQHVLFQIYIDGRWVFRRYTLTTPAGETAYREIIVQQEPDGLVSNYLFNVTDNSQQKIRLSQPMGNITFDLTKPQALICLVGGIGVTPALSALRSIRAMSSAQNQHQPCRNIFIDYSVAHKDRQVQVDDLTPSILSDSENNKQPQINIRFTDIEGVINQADINEMVESHPHGDYFVCGPTPFIDTVTDCLDFANVPKKQISIEHFSVQGAKEVKRSNRALYLGLALLAAFFIQDAFALKMPWLEALQQNDNYKIYSGLGLLLYLIMQFVLPYNRSCETPHASANSYNRHKLRGIFTPLVFYIHSTQMGVAYLFLLSCVFFGNILVGLLNHELVSDPVKRVRYFRFWLPLHISLSMVLVALIAFHVFVVASY